MLLLLRAQIFSGSLLRWLGISSIQISHIQLSQSQAASQIPIYASRVNSGYHSILYSLVLADPTTKLDVLTILQNFPTKPVINHAFPVNSHINISCTILIPLKNCSLRLFPLLVPTPTSTVGPESDKMTYLKDRSLKSANGIR